MGLWGEWGPIGTYGDTYGVMGRVGTHGGLLEGFLSRVDAPVDDEVAAGAEGAGAELADVIAFVCGAEGRRRCGAASMGPSSRRGLWGTETPSVVGAGGV